MKDEEMAEESFKRYRITDEDYEDLNGKEKLLVFNHEYGAEKQYRRLYKQGFLAGLKAGRTQWHNLRKDPNDLPKPTTPVLVILESGVPYVSWISSDKGWWFCTNYYTGEDKVIAWCEIPTFDKE